MDALKLKAGLSILAVVLVVMVVWPRPDPPREGTCETTAIGVSVIANSFKQRSVAGVAMAASSGYLANAACKKLVANLQKNPTEPQPVKVKTPGGQVVEKQVTADELARQAQADEQAYLQRQAEMQHQAQLQYQAQLNQQAQLDYEAEVAAREALDRIRREIQCLISYQDSAILYQWCVDRSIEPLVQQQTEPLVQQH